MPTKVPTQTASIMPENRRASFASCAPASSCQTLVTNDGITRIATAETGAITRLSSPIATVGRPMPTTPLTKPAAVNASTIQMVMAAVSFTEIQALV